MNNTYESRLIALIPAGGVGLRALTDGQTLPKQYRLVRNKPMIVWAALALSSNPRIESVLVGVQSDDPWAQTALSGLEKVKIRHTGGQTRAQTVLRTLRDAGAQRSDWVLVHDAARPGLPAEALERLIDACLERDQGGLLALPAADTVKSAEPDPVRVKATLPRQEIWLAQTPQMFRVGLLLDAMEGALKEGFAVTDEASAMEWAGYQPLLVPGSLRNHKVTWPEDFELVQGWL
jgi:2-C-methyl-D-erythritol 4-phosphate cytidylyltransferase